MKPSYRLLSHPRTLHGLVVSVALDETELGSFMHLTCEPPVASFNLRNKLDREALRSLHHAIETVLMRMALIEER